MSPNPSGYNNGQYTFQQQTFCMSMLTCLSFNLTGSSETITQRFKASIEEVLQNSTAQGFIGKWKLVWGPVVFADSFFGAKTSVNSMFIAAPESDPEQVVIAIAGTNGSSLVSWVLEDFNVKETVPWPHEHSPLNPRISKGAAYGLDKLMGLSDVNPSDASTMTARDFLMANPWITKVMVTGHSLGGCLSALYSLYLKNTLSDWNSSGTAVISCLTTAGQSSGDQNFSLYYGEQLADRTTRIWNSMDAIPHAFQPTTLAKVPALYEPNIAVPAPVEKLVASLLRETQANNYVNILPEASGFPSSYVGFKNIDQGKYKTFTDIIEAGVDTARRLIPFESDRIMGSIDFLVEALVQHIFPYFDYFEVNDFMVLMNTPLTRPIPSLTKPTPKT